MIDLIKKYIYREEHPINIQEFLKRNCVIKAIIDDAREYMNRYPLIINVGGDINNKNIYVVKIKKLTDKDFIYQFDINKKDANRAKMINFYLTILNNYVSTIVGLRVYRFNDRFA